ncbi:MAG: quinoprotein dehydrogenase-associated SoxYZ-like carrier [Rhodobacterales bacterium 32-67-9]|nr:MAG: quinoprotein dehydrogenase-associated SoxYZ-like carrier [Rhodobacterales bacterium 32-67-9]
MKQLLAGLSLALIAVPSGLLAAESPMVEGPTWGEISGDIVGDAVLQDGGTLLSLDAPYRAEDAATVPVVIEQTDTGPEITALKLVIDENPSPLVAEFRFGPAMHPLKLETRVRVNQYSNVRVIADTAGGSFMTGRFVKASGGCSAPATKDPAAALAGMGEMRLKLFDPEPVQQSTPRREAQIMIRHPNYSGLQRDQITQLFIPAHFIHALEVWQGDDLLFALDGGISISENPVFRFDYTDNGAPALRIHAVDTEGNVFEQMLPKDPPA